MNFIEVQDKISETKKCKISQSDIATALGVTRQTINKRLKTNSQITHDEELKLNRYFNVELCSEQIIQEPQEKNCVHVVFRPEVYLSAGYGVEVYDEHKEYMCLDERLFFTDRGTKINPKNCEIVTVSGNSMSPEYRHGDRVILDKSETHFIDGHIFAFRFNGECFIKEICLVGKRIKAIPLNKEYEPFWIEPEDEVTIFGRIVPRVRL